MYPKDYDPNKFVSKAGIRYEPVFEGLIEDGDVIELVQIGVRDLKEFHNRDAESCDVNVIVQRFQNGDITALQQVQGSYIDLSGLPKDLRGMSDMIDNLRAGYNTLSDDVKKQYPTFNNWLENVGSPDWYKLMINKTESETPGDEHKSE